MSSPLQKFDSADAAILTLIDMVSKRLTMFGKRTRFLARREPVEGSTDSGS